MLLVLVGIDRIASLTIGRALQDEFDANNSSGAGVVDWDQYGVYRCEKESGTAVITISVPAMEEAADGSKPAKRPARAPGCNAAQLYADPKVCRTLSPYFYTNQSFRQGPVTPALSVSITKGVYTLSTTTQHHVHWCSRRLH